MTPEEQIRILEANIKRKDNDIKVLTELLRSRPIPAATPASTAAPKKEEDCNDCRFEKECRHLPYVPPCYNHGMNAIEARQQEREAFAEELCAIIKHEWMCDLPELLYIIETAAKSPSNSTTQAGDP
jgi:hypothetical protein